jgi:cytochrome c556
MKRAVRQGVGILAAVGALAMAVAPARTEEPQPPTRKAFMRQKLEFAKLALEGVTLENYDLITRNARALRKLSSAAEWEVPTIPNATDYVVFTGEFQRLCDELATKARDKNLDGATLAYVRLTMSCVNCHKYVRFAR